MIYEYRVYEAMPGRMADLHAQFRNHLLKLFEKHGIALVGCWTPRVGDYSDRLVYIAAFKDANDRDRAWEAFRADPDWQKVRTESDAKGPIIRRIHNVMLTATDYSPLR